MYVYVYTYTEEKKKLKSKSGEIAKTCGMYGGSQLKLYS